MINLKMGKADKFMGRKIGGRAYLCPPEEKPGESYCYYYYWWSCCYGDWRVWRLGKKEKREGEHTSTVRIYAGVHVTTPTCSKTGE